MLARRRSAARFVLATIAMSALAANACNFGLGGLSKVPTATSSPAPATLAASATPPGPSAVLNDLVGTVMSRPDSGGKDVPATDGQTLAEGEQVRTGDGSKATIDLSDGTILRLTPNTVITLDRLTGAATNPFARLLLALGKVWVILKGGQLEVQSPAGVASVSGSFMSVEYQADTNAVLVTCLEGNCSLRNDQGGTALTTGQAASLSGGAGANPVLRWMTPAEIQAWLDDNPEAEAVAPAALTAVPTVTATETLTPTPTGTATASATATNSPTATRTATRRPLHTATSTATNTATSTATLPPKPSATHTPTPTRRGGPSATGVTQPGPSQPLHYTFDNICDPADPNGPGTYMLRSKGPKSPNLTWCRNSRRSPANCRPANTRSPGCPTMAKAKAHLATSPIAGRTP